MTVQVFTVFNKVDFMEGWGTWQESFWEISGNDAQVQWVKDSVRGKRTRMWGGDNSAEKFGHEEG